MNHIPDNNINKYDMQIFMREHIFIFYFLLCYLFIYTQAEDQYLEFYLTNFTYFNFYNRDILLFITLFLKKSYICLDGSFLSTWQQQK